MPALTRARVAPVIDAILRQDLARLLRALAAGASIEESDRYGRTALHHAVIDGDERMVGALLGNRALPSVADRGGWTPLHFAAHGHHTGIAKALVAAGATVDALDSHGNTPLHRAVLGARGRGELIRYLLSAGANPRLQNLHGVSPARLARRSASVTVKVCFDRDVDPA